MTKKRGVVWEQVEGEQLCLLPVGIKSNMGGWGSSEWSGMDSFTITDKLPHLSPASRSCLIQLYNDLHKLQQAISYIQTYLATYDLAKHLQATETQIKRDMADLVFGSQQETE